MERIVRKATDPTSPKPTTPPGAGMKWVWNDVRKSWEGRPEAEKPTPGSQDYEVVKTASVNKEEAESLFDDYVIQQDPEMKQEADIYTPQAFSRWLALKGYNQQDVNAIIGIWRGILDPSLSSKETSIDTIQSDYDRDENTIVAAFTYDGKLSTLDALKASQEVLSKKFPGLRALASKDIIENEQGLLTLVVESAVKAQVNEEHKNMLDPMRILACVKGLLSMPKEETASVSFAEKKEASLSRNASVKRLGNNKKGKILRQSSKHTQEVKWDDGSTGHYFKCELVRI
jgi:hypothetical protein